MNSSEEGVGALTWSIGDGWVPPYSSGDDPALRSHESLCMLNSGAQPASVVFTLYFSDREPAGPYRFSIPARRVLHVTMNDLCDPEPVPAGTDYSVVITSSSRIVVQHTRLDSRQAANALFSTLAHPSQS